MLRKVAWLTGGRMVMENPGRLEAGPAPDLEGTAAAKASLGGTAQRPAVLLTQFDYLALMR